MYTLYILIFQVGGIVRVKKAGCLDPPGRLEGEFLFFSTPITLYS